MMRAVRIFAVLVLIFLVSPILVIFPLSFSSGEVLTLPTPGWSLRWFQDFFLNERWLLATKHSVIVGLATMVVATVLGTLAAFGLYLSDFRGKKVVMAVLSLPMVVPVIVTASSMYVAFSVVGLTNSLTGLVIAHTIIAAPYVVITVLAAVQTFDMTLMRAALSLGANPVRAFIEVVMPMIMPGIVAGAVFAFATSFDELVIAIFLTGPEQFTLPRQMFAGLREMLSPTIAAAAVVMIGFSVVLLLITEYARTRGERLKQRAAGE
ncbi:ABC transporter permease [Chachezhania sediminis]|uniref:ABC transporter permease n=1 Tax=Chachezhania sediminis TaxID=2599291 RepID=UPI00131D9104|nr:ABC transporter permease [Chachezhania sediminis]